MTPKLPNELILEILGVLFRETSRSFKQLIKLRMINKQWNSIIPVVINDKLQRNHADKYIVEVSWGNHKWSEYVLKQLRVKPTILPIYLPSQNIVYFNFELAPISFNVKDIKEFKFYLFWNYQPVDKHYPVNIQEAGMKKSEIRTINDNNNELCIKCEDDQISLVDWRVNACSIFEVFELISLE
ncbi:hypothetical protein F8M41_025819 [Gigaspora margarita]|uniref:F-box domain-containing protein n=1 Tax=Gigaspora margarita TaxID=4874 RepID=A0A8H4ABG8_GIGMA|nr:hypothetical protein F8M41_025819 [Gigaspora margarita]